MQLGDIYLLPSWKRTDLSNRRAKSILVHKDIKGGVHRNYFSHPSFNEHNSLPGIKPQFNVTKASHEDIKKVG